MIRLYDGEPTSVPALPGVYDGIATVSVQVDERTTVLSGPAVLVAAGTVAGEWMGPR